MTNFRFPKKLDFRNISFAWHDFYINNIFLAWHEEVVNKLIFFWKNLFPNVARWDKSRCLCHTWNIGTHSHTQSHAYTHKHTHTHTQHTYTQHTHTHTHCKVKQLSRQNFLHSHFAVVLLAQTKVFKKVCTLKNKLTHSIPTAKQFFPGFLHFFFILSIFKTWTRLLCQIHILFYLKNNKDNTLKLKNYIKNELK